VKKTIKKRANDVPRTRSKEKDEGKPSSEERIKRISVTGGLVTADWPLIMTGFLLFLYVAYRAVHLSFTHDESLTYIWGIRPGLKYILSCTFVDANNHFLNTLLGYLSSSLFGVMEISLRLPNVIAALLYLSSAYFIVRKFEPFLLRLGSFLLLAVNPFLLDFFSLCRGYGLAMGFQMLSLLFMLVFIQKRGEEKRYFVASTWSAFFSVLSNFTFLNYYLVLIAVFAGLFLMFQRESLKNEAQSFFDRSFRKVLLHQAFQTGFLFLVSMPMILKLKSRGALYFGGDTGFWNDTVVSLITASLYGMPYEKWVNTVLGVMILVVLLGSAFTGFLFAGKKRRPDILAACTVLAMILLCALSTEIQYLLLGNRFLMERTALLFVPLFSLQLVLLFRIWMFRSFPIPALIMIGLCGLLIYHTFLSFNVSSSYTWRYDADTRKMIGDLIEYREHQKVKSGQVTFCGEWIYEPTVNFYRLTYNLSWLCRMTRDPVPAKACDFFYIPEKLADKVILPLKKVERYPETGMALMVRRAEMSGKE